MINIDDLEKIKKEHYDNEKSKRLMKTIYDINRINIQYNSISNNQLLDLLNCNNTLHVSETIELCNIKVSIEITLMYFEIIKGKI
jgi:hypothetical protein